MPRRLALPAALLAMLAPASGALAAPPAVTQATAPLGVPLVTWAPPVGVLGGELELARTAPGPGGEFPAPSRAVALSAGQAAWRNGERLVPGTYWVRVGSRSALGTEWSSVTTLTVAEPRIVLGRGIAGATIGMPVAAAYALLGQPDMSGAFGGLAGGRWFDHKLALTFAGAAPAVVNVQTQHPGYRVGATGVGVGTTEPQLRARLRGVRCVTYRSYGAGLRYCWVGVRAPGRVITQFVMFRGRVNAVAVGRVHDRVGDPFTAN